MKKKKIVASILIPPLLFYFFGCYSMREISKEEFTGQSEEALLLTGKMETYQLKEDNGCYRNYRRCCSDYLCNSYRIGS